MNRQKTYELAKHLIKPDKSVENLKYADTTHIVGKDYPALVHKIDVMRDERTPSSDFRRLIEEATQILGVEATRVLKLNEKVIKTPISEMVANEIAGKKMVLVPIIRAGLAMEPAMKNLYPKSRTGHAGLYRNPETLKPVQYLWKMPYGMEERTAFILDPMLATGGTADATITKLKREEHCTSIVMISVIAAPQGIKLLQDHHPDVSIYVGAVDLGLDHHGYIVPGLGDAGDRIFGTR